LARHSRTLWAGSSSGSSRSLRPARHESGPKGPRYVGLRALPRARRETCEGGSSCRR
jgi:hypothetical protein